MLDLNHVSMTFNPGTVNEKKALTDINLHMESGEFATIVGSNGAGKSTLFNAIAGSFIPDTGSILLDGVDMTFQPDFRRSPLSRSTSAARSSATCSRTRSKALPPT